MSDSVKLTFGSIVFPGCDHCMPARTRSIRHMEGWLSSPDCGPRYPGPLPKSKNGNMYALVASDYFTHWAEAYAILN